MRIIAITPEAIFNNEPEVINEILESGVDYVHVRTPKSSQLETISMIKAINPEYYSRLTLASHYSIFNMFPFGGIHIKCDMSCNSYNNVRLSKSYHHGDGLDDLNEYNYAFLSPIFDSISKSGYNSAFSCDELTTILSDKICKDKLVALGGISEKNIEMVKEIGFTGFAVLGYLFNDLHLINNRLKKLMRYK
jgi:thiamine-phosphate pyrophosphorylase